ncbi:hypothetical protein AB3Q54_05635 [Ligilactobacillus agilis]|uniref:hypothetical protein n=1 Tax=Ligilactobacillus agilis TaxID=1601 RepID=UPI0034E246F4
MQIYILNRARETLATTASIYNDKHTLTLEAGSSSYEFTIDKSDEASHYLESGNYIVLQDDKGKTWLFTILDYEETHNTKTVYAEDAGIELINKAVDIWKGDGPHPFSYYFDLVTKGTPWKLGVNQLSGLERTLTYEGRDTGLGRLLSILKGFDNAECTFDVTVKMNAPAEFKINVYKQVGNDRSDVQIVYNNELNDITKKESRAEFVTALAGVGGQIQTEDGSEGGNVDFSELEYNKDGFVTKKGDKFLRAVDANRTFNPGQESYIESFYEYDTQSPSELLNRTLSKLKTYSEPQYTYTADVKVIDSSLVLGDTVTILDHDYNPALYLSARVAKLVKSYTDPAQNEIEFTNYRLLNSALADKLARLQVIVNTLPSASRVSAIETNLTKLTKQQEEVIVKVESANGKNTNFYGGSQPESAKQGDSWFYTDEEGNQGIKQYQDGVWVDVISSKFGPKLEADIKQTQDDMQGLSDKVEEARSKAQEAFAKAGFNADEISNVKTATSEVTETLTSTVRQASELSESLKNVASETTSRYSEVSSELSHKASELASEVASNSASIAKASTQLYSQSEGLAKVSQSATKTEQTMTDLTGRVHTVETTASGTKEALADAQGRVSTLESRAGKWEQDISKKVDTSTYTAGIQNLGDKLSLKANKTDLDGYATKAQLSVESDKITQQAGEIVTVRNLANNANDKIDGLRIGGRNLLKNSRGRFQPSGSRLDNWAIYKDTTAYLENGKTYTISAKAKDGLVLSSIHEPTKQSNKVVLWMVDAAQRYNIIVSDDKTNTVGTVFKWGYPTGTYRLRVNTYNADNSGYAELVQIQEGTRATEWQPSDLDLPATIVTTVTTTTNAKQIVDSSGIYSEVTKLVDTKVGGVTTQLNSYKHTVDDTGNKLRDVMGALKLDSNGNLTSNFNELIKTASGVEERYTQLNGKIDGLKVGGRNYLRESWVTNRNAQSATYDSNTKTWTVKLTAGGGDAHDQGLRFTSAADRNLVIPYGQTAIISMEIKPEYNCQFGMDINNYPMSGSAWAGNDNDNRGESVVTPGYNLIGGQWNKVSYTVANTSPKNTNKVDIYDSQSNFGVMMKGQSKAQTVYIRYIMWELGTIAGNYYPALEDTDATIQAVTSRVTTAEGTITQVKKVADGTKSIVTQLSNLFDVNVGDSSISVTNGGVLVKGKQIHIDGQTLIDNGVIQGAKIADASIGTAKIADAAITSAKIANLDVNKLSGNKSTFVQSVWNGISGNNAKLTNSGIESVSGANRTVISGGKIETNSIITKDTIHVGQEDPDPRKQWGVDIDNKGFWFGTPVKQPGHTTNNPSDYRYELQGAIRGFGWDYTKDEITGNGMSGLVIGLAEQSMWGGNYGGDFFAIGRYVKNSTQALETASFDPAISYNATNAGFGTYNDTVNIWKNTYVRGYFSAEYEDKTRFYIGANDGDVLFLLQDKNNKNVIIDSSTHTGNGLIVKGSQNITNWLGCQDLSVRGNKNSVVQTSQGWTKINAYETAEYYFGDLGTTNTGANSLVRIDIDPIFKETVNTNVKYQVFLTSYGPGYAWVSERTENYFVIESNIPNLEVGYEIKAKRKGYEGVRLEIDKNMEERIND